MVRPVHQGCRHKENPKRHQYATVSRSGILLLYLLGLGGCASTEPSDMSSYDPGQDQAAIADLYRNQAGAMHEKAQAQMTAATRYEALFGPEDDLVSGARLLADYYEQTAKEFDRLAEAHASAGSTRPRPRRGR